MSSKSANIGLNLTSLPGSSGSLVEHGLKGGLRGAGVPRRLPGSQGLQVDPQQVDPKPQPDVAETLPSLVGTSLNLPGQLQNKPNR